MKNGVKILVACVFCMFLYVKESYAPPLPPAGQTPLDPVSWVLLGAAGAYAGKKYYDSKKEKEE